MKHSAAVSHDTDLSSSSGIRTSMRGLGNICQGTGAFGETYSRDIRSQPRLVDIYDHVFFFQAEDGIRDHCVTGVQTCALPISSSPKPSELGKARGNTERFRNTTFRLWKCPQCQTIYSLDPVDFRDIYADYPLQKRRSEERRVGKECRCRWSAYD